MEFDPNFSNTEQNCSSSTMDLVHHGPTESSENDLLGVPNLSDDLWANILEYIPAFNLLEDVAHVSQQFSTILGSRYFWLSYGEMVAKNERIWKSYQTNQVWSCLQLQQLCAFATTDRNSRYILLEQCLLPTTRDARGLLTQQRRACLASSTHHETTESIEFTLSPAERRPWSHRPAMPGWWSSQPAASKDSKENLLYLTSSPLSYVTQVKVKPLIDTFRRGLQVYSWNCTEIKAYLLPMSLIHHAAEEDGRRCSCSVATENLPLNADGDRMEALLKDQSPVYESSKFRTPTIVPKLWSDDESQWVTHDLPAGIVANAVVITLHGKTARENLGYYACVEQVKVEGIPLLSDRTALLQNVHQRRRRPWLSAGLSDSGSESGSYSAASYSGSGSDSEIIFSHSDSQ